MTLLADRVPWLRDAALADYVAGQTGRALRDDSCVAVAVAALHEAGLPVHPDMPKNWDNFLAIYHALVAVTADSPVLDAGAERYSAFLPSLRRLGWTSLTGINLAFEACVTAAGITYEPGDITATRFPPASFGYIACLSVIEHGVDTAEFLSEMARVLRPGGRLFLSFDYWETSIPTSGLVAYGVPVRIFDRSDVQSIVRCAGDHGLSLHQPFVSACGAHVVHWQRMGLRYTFANLLFRRL